MSLRSSRSSLRSLPKLSQASKASSESVCFPYAAFLSACPECDESIYRSLLSKEPEKTDKNFHLHCSVCEHEFKVPKGERASLTSGSRKYCIKQKLKKLEELGVCDLIQYETRDHGHVITHYAVCNAVNPEYKSVDVVRLSVSEGEWRVLQKTEAMDRIVQHKAFVYRFMPLDCRSMDETLSLQKRSRKQKNKEWLEREIGESATGEQFANWLKTGETKDLILRVRDVINKCPSCNKGLDRSFLVGESPPIQLFCTACSERYEVQHNPDQLKNLRKGSGNSKTEKLSSLDQLGPADVFKREIEGLPFYHHMICTGIDRIKNLIHFIDLVADDLGEKIRIQQYSQKWDDIKDADPQVFRYFPLDCLPGDETLKRVLDFATGDQKWEPEEYSLTSNNCQDFATWCKVGERRSEDRQNVAIAGVAGGSSLAVAVGVVGFVAKLLFKR